MINFTKPIFILKLKALSGLEKVLQCNWSTYELQSSYKTANYQKGILLWAAFVTLMNPQRVILETLKLYFIESSLQAAESHLLAELHLAALGRLSKNGPKSYFFSDQNSRK